MTAMLVTGLVAGVLTGFVLQRGGLCFHAMFASAGRGDTQLLRGWLLAVGIGGVGLALLYASPAYDGLNEGLAFRPVRNLLGGLVVGVGMAVARSCASGLFYKLGTGMLGAAVGIVGWVAGELAASHVTIGGPTVLAGGTAGTLAGLLGLPRLLVAAVVLALLVAVCLALARRAADDAVADPYDGTRPSTRWSWRRTGVALGVVLVATWLLAGAGGASYGASTVGASVSLADGSPSWWLIAFLVGLVPGGHLGARVGGDLRVRGEEPVRYVQLVVGGFLLGAGGWIAGGCNLGHGLSGTAQLNVASWVAVAAMAAGVVATRAVLDRGVRERIDA